MRINDKTVGGIERSTGEAKAKSSTVSEVPETTSSYVKVNVSEASKAVMASVSHSTQARAERVQQIAQMVRAGAYPVDLDNLASSIASDEMARAS